MPAVPVALAPLLLSLVAWMVSGSPLPLALTAALLSLAALARLGSRLSLAGKRAVSRQEESDRLLVPALLVAAALAAATWQAGLFRDGSAFAFRAELPAPFHPAFALLWLAAALRLAAGPKGATGGALESLLGTATFVGLSLGLWGALASERYDYALWQFLPFALLPWLLIGYCCLRLRDTRASRSPVARRLPGGVAFVTLATASFVLSLGLAALEDGAHRLASVLRSPPSLAFDDEEPAPTPLARDAGGDRSGSRHLARKADLRFDDRIRVYLKTESEELFDSWLSKPLYLRTSTLSVFESDEVLSPLRTGRWFFAGGEDGDDPGTSLASSEIALPAALFQSAPLHDYALYIERDSADSLPLLPGTASVHVDALHEFGDDWFQLVPAQGVERLRYAASAPAERVALPDEFSALRHLEGSEVYLETPETPLLRRIEASVAGLPGETPLAGLLARFRDHTRYSLSYETPEGVGALESFLYGGGAGHCELYAAAAVLKLRSLGIPARVAYGFAGGLVDESERAIAFRDRDFHAWAEILTPSLEWGVFDATSGVVDAPGQRARPHRLAATDWDRYTDYSLGRFAAPESNAWERAFADALAWASRHFPALFGGGLAVAAILGAALRARRRRTGGPGSGPVPAALAARRGLAPWFAELEALGARFGLERRKSETWSEYLRRIAADSGDGASLPEAVGEALRYHYRVRYAGHRPDPSAERAHLRALRRWGGP